MKKILQKTFSKGFTLLETLTSIAVLSLAIIGPLSVIISSSSYARQTKDTIVATYLAEEAIELVQNQYDSLYIYCKNNFNQSICTTSSDETSGQVSWRLFKNRFNAASGQPSCYGSESVNGCSFDFVDMNAVATATPVRYSPENALCSGLVPVDLSVMSYGGEGQYSSSTYQTFVCKGATSHMNSGTPNTTKVYTRTLVMEQLPTFEGGVPVDNQYNDDLRMTAKVQYKGVNGVTKTITVTRLLHPRP